MQMFSENKQILSQAETGTFSPVWLELSSLPSIFSTPGDSPSGVPKVPSESELWRERQRALMKHLCIRFKRAITNYKTKLSVLMTDL